MGRVELEISGRFALSKVAHVSRAAPAQAGGVVGRGCRGWGVGGGSLPGSFDFPWSRCRRLVFHGKTGRRLHSGQSKARAEISTSFEESSAPVLKFWGDRTVGCEMGSQKLGAFQGFHLIFRLQQAHKGCTFKNKHSMRITGRWPAGFQQIGCSSARDFMSSLCSLALFMAGLWCDLRPWTFHQTYG